MNIVICDDQIEQINKLEKVCKKNCVDDDQILCFSSSKELCDVLIDQHPRVDLFILDIEMPELSGLQVKKLISDLYADTNIVFLTSHREMMQDAFGRQVRGFLKKGDDEEKLAYFLDEIHIEQNKKDEITIVDGKQECVLKKSHIVMIQAQHVYSRITLYYYRNNDRNLVESRNVIFRISLTKWENLLQDDDFFRVGRNYIVNLAFVKRITDEIILETGEVLQVPVKKLRDVKKVYNQYCAKVARSIW